MPKTAAANRFFGVYLIALVMGNSLVLTGCGPNLSLSRATPAPVTVAPLRQTVEAVPPNAPSDDVRKSPLMNGAAVRQSDAETAARSEGIALSRSVSICGR